MVRGGATKPTGNSAACLAISALGPCSVGTDTAMLARPLAALSAAITQARTFGVAKARHASRSPFLLPAMHAWTMGRPTEARQFSIASSFDKAEAFWVPASANPSAKPASLNLRKTDIALLHLEVNQHLR